MKDLEILYHVSNSSTALRASCVKAPGPPGHGGQSSPVTQGVTSWYLTPDSKYEGDRAYLFPYLIIRR